MKNMFLTVGLVASGLALVLAGTALAAGPAGAGGYGGMMHGRSNMSLTPSAAVGTVASISGDTITLTGRNNTTYSVDATNAMVMKGSATSSVSAIATGDTLMVQGTVNGTSITATTIRDGFGPGMMGGLGRGSMIPGIFGAVASINGTTLTVTSKVGSKGATATIYTVNAANATVMKNGATTTLSSVIVGDNIFAAGTLNGTSITATTIRDGIAMGGSRSQVGSPKTTVIQGNGEPVVGGAITAITGTTLTVTNKSNVTYTIDASSATIEKMGATTTISGVIVGDNILAQGTVNGNAVTASSIIDQGSVTNNTTTSSGAPATAPKGIFGAIGNFFQHIFGFF
jgi:hypothetical protein